VGGQIDIENVFAMVAIKMTVFTHVWAKPGSATLESDLPHDTTFDEGIQAIVNCGHGDIGHVMLGAHEDFLCGGVIAFFEQHVVHLLTLRRKTKSAGGEPLI